MFKLLFRSIFFFSSFVIDCKDDIPDSDYSVTEAEGEVLPVVGPRAAVHPSRNLNR